MVKCRKDGEQQITNNQCLRMSHHIDHWLLKTVFRAAAYFMTVLYSETDLGSLSIFL
jgi:hypothetical protein